MNDEEQFDVLDVDFAGDETGRSADAVFTDRFPGEASRREVAA